MPMDNALSEFYFKKAQEEYEDGDLEKSLDYLHTIPLQTDIVKQKIMQLEEELKTEKDKPQQKKEVGYRFTQTFNDVIGLKKTKERMILDILMPIQNPEAVKAIGLQRRAGLLLYGPPGTGKTSLVRALSGEAKLKVILARIDEIKSPYSAETERNMHKKFEEARENAPCILFFDEIEALGAKRESLGGEGSAEILKAAINVFIMEMDGIQSKNEDVYVIGASNQPWAIDAALKRSGRLDSCIYVSLPNRKERIQLFKYYLKDMPTRTKIPLKVDYGRLASITDRYPPADIQKICQMAGKLDLRSYTKKLSKGQKPKLSPINMYHLLSVLRSKEGRKSSIEEWFSNNRKKLIGTVKIQKVGKRKVAIQQSAELEEDERARYKELIADILKSQKHNVRKKIIRLIRLYVI